MVYQAPEEKMNASFNQATDIVNQTALAGVPGGQIFVNPVQSESGEQLGLPLSWASFIKQFPNAGTASPFYLLVNFPNNTRFPDMYCVGLIVYAMSPEGGSKTILQTLQ